MSKKSNYWQRSFGRRLTRRRLMRGVAVGGLSVAAAAVIGCGEEEAAPTATPTAMATPATAATATATAVAEIKPQGKLVHAGAGSAVFETFNPLEYYSGGQDVWRFAVADYLLHWADEGDTTNLVVPALAQSYEITPDGLTVTFKLNPSAKFHDGTQVTSEDVKFSWELTLDPDFRHVRKPELKLGLDHIETPDATTAVFKMKGVWLDVIDRNPQWAIISKAHFEKVGAKGYADGNTIAAGPFRLVAATKGESSDLVAVEGHYRKTPFIKDLLFRRAPERATAIAMLETKEADIISVNPADLPTVEGIRGAKVLNLPHSSSNLLYFKDMIAVPQGQSPMHDKRVREAVSIAIDRKAIVNSIFAGLYDTSGSISTNRTPGYDPTIPIHEYNPERAKQLMKEAGYEGGFQTIFYASTPIGEWVPAMVDYWKAIGVTIDLRTAEATAYNDMILDKTRPGLYIQATAAQVSPTGYLTFLQKEGRYSHYDDPVMEDLVTKLSLEPDREKRNEIWKQIQWKVYEDLRYATLWQSSTVVATGPRVKKWVPRGGVVLGTSNYEWLELA